MGKRNGSAGACKSFHTSPLREKARVCQKKCDNCITCQQSSSVDRRVVSISATDQNLARKDYRYLLTMSCFYEVNELRMSELMSTFAK